MDVKFGYKNEDQSGFIEMEGKLGKGNWLLHSICQWEQMLGRWNWIDFNFVQFHVMRDIVLPGFELEIIILGIGFRLRVNDDWSKTEVGRDLLSFRPEEYETDMVECPFCGGSGEVRESEPRGESDEWSTR